MSTNLESTTTAEKAQAERLAMALDISRHLKSGFPGVLALMHLGFRSETEIRRLIHDTLRETAGITPQQSDEDIQQQLATVYNEAGKAALNRREIAPELQIRGKALQDYVDNGPGLKRERQTITDIDDALREHIEGGRDFRGIGYFVQILLLGAEAVIRQSQESAAPGPATESFFSTIVTQVASQKPREDPEIVGTLTVLRAKEKKKIQPKTTKPAQPETWHPKKVLISMGINAEDLPHHISLERTVTYLLEREGISVNVANQDAMLLKILAGDIPLDKFPGEGGETTAKKLMAIGVKYEIHTQNTPKPSDTPIHSETISPVLLPSAAPKIAKVEENRQHREQSFYALEAALEFDDNGVWKSRDFYRFGAHYLKLSGQENLSASNKDKHSLSSIADSRRNEILETLALEVQSIVDFGQKSHVDQLSELLRKPDFRISSALREALLKLGKIPLAQLRGLKPAIEMIESAQFKPTTLRQLRGFLENYSPKIPKRR